MKKICLLLVSLLFIIDFGYSQNLIISQDSTNVKLKKRRPSFIEGDLGIGLPISKFKQNNPTGIGEIVIVQGAWFFAHNIGIGANTGLSLYSTTSSYTMLNSDFKYDISFIHYDIGAYFNIPLQKSFAFTGHILAGAATAQIGSYTIYSPMSGQLKAHSSSGTNFSFLVGIGCKEIFGKHWGISFNADYFYSKISIIQTFDSDSLPDPFKMTNDYYFTSVKISIGFCYVF